MTWCNSCDGEATWEIRNCITLAQHRRLYSCTQHIGDLVSEYTENSVLPLTPTLKLVAEKTPPPYQTLVAVAA